MAVFFFFFFNDTATTEIYTLSLHDALPIFELSFAVGAIVSLLHDVLMTVGVFALLGRELTLTMRSEEHTSELQSQSNLVCRLLLEKKNKQQLPLVQSDTTAAPQSVPHPTLR